MDEDSQKKIEAIEAMAEVAEEEAEDAAERLQRLESVKKVIEKNKIKNVELIVVTKKCSMQKIKPMLEHHNSFAENRIQEACEKWSELKKNSTKIRLHAIGAVQTNKVAEAVKLFDCIHTLDRERLAEALANEMEKSGRKIPCFVQVNVGGEAQKSGVALDATDEFIEQCRNRWKLPICGLMCMPPQGKMAAPYFALLAKIAKKHRLENLSMGMSSDYQQALELGATHVRIGTAIMGER